MSIWPIKRNGYLVDVTRIPPAERVDANRWLVEVTQPGGTSSTFFRRRTMGGVLRVFYRETSRRSA